MPEQTHPPGYDQHICSQWPTITTTLSIVSSTELGSSNLAACEQAQYVWRPVTWPVLLTLLLLTELTAIECFRFSTIIR